MPHQLIICEKPSSAEKIAKALAEGGIRSVGSRWTPAYRIERGGNTITVASAIGHLYSVDQQNSGWTFPIFNLRWVPLYEADRKAGRTRAWIESISRLAAEADSFVSACDYDTEGSLIAYMILRHACRGGDARARRMKFSTLTKEDLVEAYGGMAESLDYPVIEAGRVRHELDWIFGVNVSRALMDAHRVSGGSFEALSAGRVQSPTLNALCERELEIGLHVPDPFWTMRADVEIGGSLLKASYREAELYSKKEAGGVAKRCNGATGRVSSVRVGESVIHPPCPFDLGTLQSEAYTLFRFMPSKTLSVAERLYLDAAISYPRTSSQRLPPSLNFKGIMQRLAKNQRYRGLVEELLAEGRPLTPRQGWKTDPAHPAIHPTGNLPGRGMLKDELRLYDLIVRRFLAAFGRKGFKRVTEVEIDCGSGDIFFVRGEVITDHGWIASYGPYYSTADVPIPEVEIGDPVVMKRVWPEENFTQPPPRYNPSSLVRFMEKNGLGTKATRAYIVDTMYRRGYIQGGSITVTDLGFAVVRVLKEHFPGLVSMEMTRRLEAEMRDIEAGTRRAEDVLVDAIEGARGMFADMIERLGEAGEGLAEVAGLLRGGHRGIGACPRCGSTLVVTHSRKTGKRFVGCSGYSKGCRFSLPLPQRGRITPSGSACSACGYPIIEVRGLGRRAWRLCVNVECPSKARKRNLQDLRKGQ